MLQTVNCPSSMIACMYEYSRMSPRAGMCREESPLHGRNRRCRDHAIGLSEYSEFDCQSSRAPNHIGIHMSMLTDPRFTKRGRRDRNDRRLPSDLVSRPRVAIKQQATDAK